MPIYNFSNNELAKIKVTSFSSHGILERSHLQAALKEQIEVIAPNSLVISEEFSEWSGSQRRIDLLAVDRQANLVVIELKRDETGEHMDLQALRYAAMVSTLTFKRAVEIFQNHLDKSERVDDVESLLLDFLDWEAGQEDGFADEVRIILVSADFSKELTTSVMWLNDRGLDIRCVRLIPHNFDGKVLIDVQQVIPLPEATSYQIKIRQKNEESRVVRRSQKDYTKYQFEDQIFNKRRLVLAVVQTWISDNKPGSLPELGAAFPQDIKSGGIFTPLAKAEAIYKRQGRSRHFLAEDELIVFPDSSKYAISNQWKKESLDNFVKRAVELGFYITEEV